MTTKDQESKALAKIKDIIDGLGADSYVGKAFEGCYEIAVDNIRDDFFDSMKERKESAEKGRENAWKELAEKKAENKELKRRAEEAERIANSKIESADNWCAKYHEAADMAKENWNKFREQEDKVAELEQQIINLKAKLYDMMVGA